MASLVPNTHSFPPDENHRPADPFWQATPRSTPTTQDIELLMAAQQIFPQPSAVAPPRRYHRVIIRHNAARVPACTHITMDRVYGENTCQMCGKVPAIGWLYSCQQDRLLQSLNSNIDTEVLPAVSDSDNYFEAQAKIAEAIGMSKSVISQMRRGEYSFDQIEILLQQRRHVLDVIRRAEHASTHSTPSQSPAATHAQLPVENIIASVGSTAAPAVQDVNSHPPLPMSPAGTPANTPHESKTTTPTRERALTKKTTCKYQVCHACRPFLQDRLPVGLGPVLNNEVPAVTETDIEKLPLHNPNIVRNLGLRQPPVPSGLAQSHDVTDAAMHTIDGQVDDVSELTPTTSSSAFDTDESEAGSDLYPCPGPGLCAVASSSGGCVYDAGFDDGNRIFHHGLTSHNTIQPSPQSRHILDLLARATDGSRSTSSAGSSISLPEPITEPLTPTSPRGLGINIIFADKLGDKSRAHTSLGFSSETEKERSTSRSSSIESNCSSVGSELEVEGGVALTEEAVGSGLPDIATSEVVVERK